jgi:hypothetical protein
MIRRYVALGVFLVATAACGNKQEAAQRDSTPAESTGPTLSPGEAYLAVPDGRIWYRQVGTGIGTPVILLHGRSGRPALASHDGS